MRERMFLKIGGLLLAVALLSFSAVGCGGDSGTSCDSDCSTEGSTQCSGNAVETCTVNDKGCLAWSQTIDCTDSGRICDQGSGHAICVAPCDDECAGTDSDRCDAAGLIIQTCTKADDGCFYWTDGTDCSLNTPPQICDDSGIAVLCVDPCVSECADTDSDHCDDAGLVIQTCTEADDGCFYWTDGTDCSLNTPPQICDDSGIAALCVDPCVSECADTDSDHCDDAGLVIQTCTEADDGCFYWMVGTDCSLNTPPLVCDDWSGADPVCVNGTGDSCDDIYSIGVLSPPFVGSGSDFMADYANDHEFSDLEGCGNASGAEAVFSVYLAQYETLSMQETGNFDAVWRVLEMCDDTAGACLLSADDGTNDEAVFLAMEEGYYYVILESYSSNPADVDYDFSIALRAPESDCGNGADDDGDSYADCEDPDCFGDATNCTDEVGLCDDAFDNDNDGLTDCFDADDCGGVPACNLRLGPWEEFGSYTIVATDYYYPVDLTNCHLVYTPQTVWPHGYDVVSWCNCEAPAWVIAPTGGVAVSLGDDDHTALVATSFPDFNFFGTTYAEVIVESNGWLSFDGAASDVPISDEGGFFSLPIIAGVAGNLDPSSGGSISYHDTVSAFVVTFEDVPYHGQTETVSFQIILNADETIEVYFLSTEMLDEGKNVFTGLSNGVNNDTPPPEDFVIPGPGVGDVIITEFMFNPNVVDDAAGEFIELYNRSPRAINLGCCELHDNTGDLALNEIIDEHAYAVYVRSANPLDNGGIEGGYEMGTAIQISDDTPENLSLTCYANNTVIDILPFDAESSWPGGGVGISAQLSTMSYDAELNDDITHWCDASEAYGAGDLGSPGELNNNTCMTEFVSEDFERDPLWATLGDWEWGVPDLANYPAGPIGCAAGSSGCYGTNMSGGYSSNMTYDTNYLQSGDIDLTNLTLDDVIYLHFDIWLTTEAGFDFADVAVSNDSGASWLTLPMYAPPYNSGTPAAEWSEAAGSWRAAIGILNGYGGDTVQIRWRLRSDNSMSYPGFYIDNMSITTF